MHYTKAFLNEETVLLKQRVAYSGTNAEYIGYAPPGSAENEAVWIIHKLTYVSSLMTKKDFADGSKAFDKKWSERTGYTYA